MFLCLIYNVSNTNILFTDGTEDFCYVTNHPISFNIKYVSYGKGQPDDVPCFKILDNYYGYTLDKHNQKEDEGFHIQNRKDPKHFLFTMVKPKIVDYDQLFLKFDEYLCLTIVDPVYIIDKDNSIVCDLKKNDIIYLRFFENSIVSLFIDRNNNIVIKNLEKNKRTMESKQDFNVYIEKTQQSHRCFVESNKDLLDLLKKKPKVLPISKKIYDFVIKEEELNTEINHLQKLKNKTDNFITMYTLNEIDVKLQNNIKLEVYKNTQNYIPHKEESSENDQSNSSDKNILAKQQNHDNEKMFTIIIIIIFSITGLFFLILILRMMLKKNKARN